jgi:hypothetical protein
LLGYYIDNEQNWFGHWPAHGVFLSSHISLRTSSLAKLAPTQSSCTNTGLSLTPTSPPHHHSTLSGTSKRHAVVLVSAGAARFIARIEESADLPTRQVRQSRQRRVLTVSSMGDTNGHPPNGCTPNGYTPRHTCTVTSAAQSAQRQRAYDRCDGRPGCRCRSWL